jgi:hypothetical protein
MAKLSFPFLCPFFALRRFFALSSPFLRPFFAVSSPFLRRLFAVSSPFLRPFFALSSPFLHKRRLLKLSDIIIQ